MTPDDYIKARVDSIMALVRDHEKIGFDPAAAAITQLAQDRADSAAMRERACAERNGIELRVRRECMDQLKKLEAAVAAEQVKYSDLFNKTHIYDDDAGGMVLVQDIERMHRARAEAELAAERKHNEELSEANPDGLVVSQLEAELVGLRAELARLKATHGAQWGA